MACEEADRCPSYPPTPSPSLHEGGEKKTGAPQRELKHARFGAKRRRMGINLNPFTWWNGATVGTWFGLRGKTRVGEDSLGNVYYEGGADTAGRPRRWVPDRALPAPRRWEKPAVPNMTGTALAYRPPGALEKGGVRAAATGDYEAWSPEA